MAELKADVLVLGAGMVGVGAALHLQKRGRNVVLIDRHEVAGEETSYGNGGLIECASVFPYMFPREIGQIISTDAYHQARAACADDGRRAIAIAREEALVAILYFLLISGSISSSRKRA